MCVYFFIDFYESKQSKSHVPKNYAFESNFEALLSVSFRLRFMKRCFKDVTMLEGDVHLKQERKVMIFAVVDQPKNKTNLILLPTQQQSRNVS